MCGRLSPRVVWGMADLLKHCGPMYVPTPTLRLTHRLELEYIKKYNRAYYFIFLFKVTELVFFIKFLNANYYIKNLQRKHYSIAIFLPLALVTFPSIAIAYPDTSNLKENLCVVVGKAWGRSLRQWPPASSHSQEAKVLSAFLCAPTLCCLYLF